jgi:hypothetical protein
MAQLLLDEITVTGRKVEIRGILPAADVLQFCPQRQHVVPAASGYLQRPFRSDLTAHVFEIQ